MHRTRGRPESARPSPGWGVVVSWRAHRATAFVIALFGLPVLPSDAAGQDDPAGALVLETPSSTEAMAYGDAPYLFGSDPGLLFYAPGLIRRSAGVAVSLQRYGGEGTLASAAGAAALLGGGLAVGVQYMRYGAITGLPDGRDLQSVALSPGDVGLAEFVASVGYGRTVRGVDVGVVLKHVEQSVDGDADASLALDVGLANEVGPLMISLTARNLGPDLEIEPGGTTAELELPAQVTAALSIEQFEVGPLDMFLTSRVTRRRDGEVIPAGGWELSYWPLSGYTFRVRAGVQRVVDDARSPFTVGAAFTGDALTIEWAFQPFDGEGSAHRIGLRWR
jgi:hypothetical protein